ncbi:MAG: hypothetical protein KGJ77_07565 [Acidobacteriota bacterium]|nr:hypothetical protein [Acidobacteriota bacterium]
MSERSEHERTPGHEEVTALGAATTPEVEGDAGGDPAELRPYTSFGTRSNRRARAGALRNCRLCWKPITVDARFVEEAPPRTFFRCPYCSQAFPIRRSDVQPPTAEAAPLPAPARPEADTSGPPVEIWSTLERSVIDLLDLDAVRALLNQIEAIHTRHGSTEESLALRDTLCAREQLLIALEDVGQAVASIEAEFPPTR